MSQNVMKINVHEKEPVQNLVPVLINVKDTLVPVLRGTQKKRISLEKLSVSPNATQISVNKILRTPQNVQLIRNAKIFAR